MRHALLFTIGGALGVAALGLASTASGSARDLAPNLGRFELVADGAVHLSSVGDAAIGAVAGEGEGEGGRLVLTLGGREGTAAVVVTRWTDELPAPGTYAVVPQHDGATGFTAMFVPGSPDRPIGAFHAVGGTVTITSVTPDAVTGSFRLETMGFLAENPSQEDRVVTVRGAFTARRGADAVAAGATTAGEFASAWSGTGR